MSRIFRHIFIPAAAPLLFFIIATTPVEVIGCRTRGLLALMISLISGLSALGTAIIGIKDRARGDSNAIWWVVSHWFWRYRLLPCLLWRRPSNGLNLTPLAALGIGEAPMSRAAP
jgi:hypothetical protein